MELESLTYIIPQEQKIILFTYCEEEHECKECSYKKRDGDRTPIWKKHCLLYKGTVYNVPHRYAKKKVCKMSAMYSKKDETSYLVIELDGY